jgi:hypothetical protein
MTLKELKSIRDWFMFDMSLKQPKNELINNLLIHLKNNELVTMNPHPLLKDLLPKRNSTTIHTPCISTNKANQNSNPYQLLTDKTIDKLFILREVEKPACTRTGLCKALDFLDEIDPSWKVKVNSLDLNAIRTEMLNDRMRTMIHCYAAYAGFDMNLVEDYGMESIIKFINLWKSLALPKKEPITLLPNKLPVTTNILSYSTNLCEKVLSNINLTPLRRNFLKVCSHINLVSDDFNKMLLEDQFRFPVSIDEQSFKLLLYMKDNTLDIYYKNYVNAFFPEITADCRFTFKYDKIFLLSRGYRYPIEHATECHLKCYRRLEMFEKCPSEKLNAILQLYGTESHYDPFTSLLTIKPNALEQFIINMPDDTNRYMKEIIEDMAKKCGMIIPYLKTETEKDYFIDNLKQYKDLFSKKRDKTKISLNTLEYFSDGEIMAFCQAFLQYNTRETLINNAKRFHSSKSMFFIPIPKKRGSSKNKSTYVVQNDINDLSVFLIAYGNDESFVCFDIDDLLTAFIIKSKTEGSDDKMLFRKPNQHMFVFSNYEIKTLLNLLKSFQKFYHITIPDADELIEKMEQGLEMNKLIVDTDKRLLQSFNMFNHKEKAMIKQFLYKVFECGMYMRRWKGPGNDFPFFEFETRNSTVDPLDKSAIALAELDQIMSAIKPSVLQFCLALQTLNVFQSMTERTMETFKDIFDKTVRELSCIRVNSTIFVGTTYYYYNLFWNENIPNFSIKHLMNVQ